MRWKFSTALNAANLCPVTKRCALIAGLISGYKRVNKMAEKEKLTVVLFSDELLPAMKKSY